MCKVHAIRKQINMMILVAHWTRRGGHVRDNIVCVCACNTCSRENDSTRRARPFNPPIRFKCAHSHRSRSTERARVFAPENCTTLGVRAWKNRSGSRAAGLGIEFAHRVRVGGLAVLGGNVA